MKDPAFLFYSKDFYLDTSTMSFEDRGKYITLLCIMHQNGRQKEETIWFLLGSVSDTLKSKFRIDENGLWYNERLELEIAARAKYVDSRRENGKNGGRPRKEKAYAKPYDIANGKPYAEPYGKATNNHTADAIADVNINEIIEGVQGEISETEQENPDPQKQTFVTEFRQAANSTRQVEMARMQNKISAEEYQSALELFLIENLDKFQAAQKIPLSYFNQALTGIVQRGRTEPKQTKPKNGPTGTEVKKQIEKNYGY